MENVLISVLSACLLPPFHARNSQRTRHPLFTIITTHKVLLSQSLFVYSWIESNVLNSARPLAVWNSAKRRIGFVGCGSGANGTDSLLKYDAQNVSGFTKEIPMNMPGMLGTSRISSQNSV